MDLATLIADKPLLAGLSREYELLKACRGDDVDYEAWIVKRLRQAAAARSGALRGADEQQEQPAQEPDSTSSRRHMAPDLLAPAWQPSEATLDDGCAEVCTRHGARLHAWP